MADVRTQYSLLRGEVKEIADALTAMNIRDFSLLNENNLIEKLNGDPQAIVVSMSYNQLSYLVVNDILKGRGKNDLIDAVLAIEKWINVAYHLAFESDITNYNAAKSIYDGLSLNPVFRLFQNKKIKNVLAREAYEKWEKLDELLSLVAIEEKKLSTAIAENKKCIPPISICIRDLTVKKENPGDKNAEESLRELKKITRPLMENIEVIKNNQSYQTNMKLESLVQSQAADPLKLSKNATEEERNYYNQQAKKYNTEVDLLSKISQEMIPKEVKDADRTEIENRLKLRHPPERPNKLAPRKKEPFPAQPNKATTAPDVVPTRPQTAPGVPARPATAPNFLTHMDNAFMHRHPQNTQTPRERVNPETPEEGRKTRPRR